jgi:hypothetical protein
MRKKNKIGKLMIIAGIALAAIAFIDFIISMATFGRGKPNEPTLFYLFFLGFPLIFAGFVVNNKKHIQEIILNGTEEQTEDPISKVEKKCPSCGAINKTMSPKCPYCDYNLKK